LRGTIGLRQWHKKAISVRNERCSWPTKHPVNGHDHPKDMIPLLRNQKFVKESSRSPSPAKLNRPDLRPVPRWSINPRSRQTPWTCSKKPGTRASNSPIGRPKSFPLRRQKIDSVQGKEEIASGYCQGGGTAWQQAAQGTKPLHTLLRASIKKGPVL